MQREVLCDVLIKKFQNLKPWCHTICTSCYQKTSLIENEETCMTCQRIVPYGEKMYVPSLIWNSFRNTHTLHLSIVVTLNTFLQLWNLYGSCWWYWLNHCHITRQGSPNSGWKKSTSTNWGGTCLFPSFKYDHVIHKLIWR